MTAGPLQPRAPSSDSGSPVQSEAAFERAIVRLLRAGIMVSLGLIILGFVLWDAGGLGGGDLLQSRPLLSVGSLSEAGATALLLGLLVIIVTPMARVGLSVVLFARKGDSAFVRLTLFVLAVLLATVAAGVWT